MKLSEISKGLKAYGTAFDIIGKHGLWTYMLIPGAISAVFFIIIAVVAFFTVGGLSDSIVSQLPDWLAGAFMKWFFAILIAVLVILMALFLVKYLVLIILSPVLSHLSEVTEKKIAGIEPPKMNIGEMMSDIIRAIKINVRNLMIELALTIGLFILSFIPLLNFITPLVTWLVESHYVGFGLVDYTLERKRFTTSQTIQWVGLNRGLTTGLGMGFMLITIVPVIGWFLAPVVGTVASTIAVLAELRSVEEAPVV